MRHTGLKNFDRYYDDPFSKENFKDSYTEQEPEYKQIPTQAEMEAQEEELARLYPEKFGIEAFYRKMQILGI